MTLRICNPKTVFSCVKMIIDGLGGIEAFFFSVGFSGLFISGIFHIEFNFFLDFIYNLICRRGVERLVLGASQGSV